MATTTATLTLSSADLVGNSLNLSSASALNKAGTNTGLDQASGLSRKQTSSVDTYTVYKADEYTANKAHKVYLKNISTTATEFFTVTFAATWATDDIAVFDGVTITLAATETVAAMAILVGAAKYPNFTAAVTATGVVTFTAKDSNDLSLIEEGAASDDYVITTAGNGTGTVARTVAPVASSSDIKITPSVATAMTLESMLIFEA